MVTERTNDSDTSVTAQRCLVKKDVTKSCSVSNSNMSTKLSLRQIKSLLNVPEKSKAKDLRLPISSNIASVILKVANINNRPISDSKVNVYLRDMQLGNWSEDSTDAIAFDTNGVLVNGQHRLKALSKANTTIVMLVSFGITPFMGMDTGRTRTLANNVLMFDGADKRFRESKYKVCLSVMNSVQRFSTGSYIFKSNLTPNEQIELANKYADELILLADNDIFSQVSAMGANGKSKPITSSSVYAAFFLAYMNNVPLSTLIHIREKLKDVTNATVYDRPILSLRDVLVSTIGGGREPDCIRCFGTQYCINAVINKSRSKSCKSDTGFYTLDIRS